MSLEVFDDSLPYDVINALIFMENEYKKLYKKVEEINKNEGTFYYNKYVENIYRNIDVKLKKTFGLKDCGEGYFKKVYAFIKYDYVLAITHNRTSIKCIQEIDYEHVPALDDLRKSRLSKHFLFPVASIGNNFITVSEKVYCLNRHLKIDYEDDFYETKFTIKDIKDFDLIKNRFGINKKTLSRQIIQILKKNSIPIKHFIDTTSEDNFDLHQGNIGICPKRKKVVAFDW